MDVRAPKSNVQVVTFPADDVVFSQRVDEVGRVRGEWDAADLEAALRRIHPHVATRWRNQLAGFGDQTLYVFRDGTVTASNDSDDWTRLDSTARVVTNESGQYLDANEAAEALFGVSRDRIIGAHAGSFTEPDARILEEDALWRALNATGKLHSLALVCRPEGSTISVEFITERDGDGPRRNVTYLRAVE